MPYGGMASPVIWLGLAGLLALTVHNASGQGIISLAETKYAVREGEQFTVTLRKTGTAASPINVVVEVSSVNQNGVQDFIGSSQTTVFQAGIEEVLKSVIFTVLDDDIPEGDEVYIIQVRVTNGDGLLGAPDTGTVTVVANDEGFGIFGFLTPSPVLADESQGDYPINLNIQRSQGTYDTVSVHFEVIGLDGSTPEQDVTPVTGQVDFAEGESLKQLKLTIIDDQDPENDESFVVRLVGVSGGASVSPESNRPKLSSDQNKTEVTVVIRRNDAPVRFSQIEYRVDEDSYDVPLSVTIYRGLDRDGLTVLGPVNRLAMVNYYFVSGTATETADFHGSNGTIGFSPGTMEATITVHIVSDLLPEVAERFQLVLAGATGDVVLAEPRIATVIINANDDFNGVLSLKSSNGQVYPVVRVDEDAVASVNEFSIVRNGGLYGTVSVQWMLIRNDSNIDPVTMDVLPTAGTVTFLESEREKPIVFSISQDQIPEPAERYVLKLLPESVTGGARAEGILQGELVIEDSDEAYGTVQFTADNAQYLITNLNPRRLTLSVSRMGGTLGSVSMDFRIVYSGDGTSAADVFRSQLPGTATFPAGITSHSFDVLIKDEAFLEVGAQFEITLTAVTLAIPDDVGPFNTPKLGSKTSTIIFVSPEAANGEVGFASTDDVIAVEPPPGVDIQQVLLPISRDGTNGDVEVTWTMAGGGANPDHVTPADAQPLNGTIIIPSGQATGTIVIEILADDLAETDEFLDVLLTKVTPEDTQRLRPGAARITVIISENDNPGGVFEFGPEVNTSYVVREEEDAIEMTIIRTGGALVYREIQYYIEPNGDAEFYGGLNVVKFFPGDVQKEITVLAKQDIVPELTEEFILRLRTFGDKEAKIGAKSLVKITVLANEEPFGQFQFPSLDFTVTTGESKGGEIALAQVTLLRAWGRFGTSTIDWYVVDAENNTDISPLSGTLTYEPGVGEKFINIEALADEIPEAAETFTIMIENPTGPAKLGQYTRAYVTIVKNDDAIRVLDPAMVRVSEPGQHTFTIVRDGPRDVVASVRYRTSDVTAHEGSRDYVGIMEQSLLFDVGEHEKTITVQVLDDTLAEPDETFIIELYDAQGDVAVYGEPPTVIIIANDGSNGVFSFLPPFSLSIDEGKPARFELKREEGIFNMAKVYYAITYNTTGMPLASGQGPVDFSPNDTHVTFKDREQIGYLDITPTADGIPEYSEKFTIRLTHVEGGPPSDPGRLASADLEVYLDVLKNDDPNGVFQFPSTTREISIAEDILPGQEESAVARFTVERTQGTFGVVEVAWEVYSYQIAGAGNLPDFVDLLFIGDAPASVPEALDKRRPRTGTKVLQFTGCPSCYVTVPAEYQPTEAEMEGGFSVTAWVQLAPNADGYIFAKTSPDGQTVYYAVRVRTITTEASSTAFFDFYYTVATAPGNQRVSRSANVNLADGDWHFLLFIVDQGNVTFYMDGSIIGVTAMRGATALQDGEGVLWIGAAAPGIGFFAGLMQDVRIYSRKLDEGTLTPQEMGTYEIRELYEMPSVHDLTPISGYIKFFDGPSSTEVSIVIAATDDVEEEANDVFTVKLTSVRGGGRVSPTNNAAVLTVLKSDNANGLFGFSGECVPEAAETEDAIFSCPVERLRGDADTVTLVWEIHQVTSGGTDAGLASSDFVNATGTVVFPPGERQKTVMFQVADDTNPEEMETFQLRIVDLLPADKLVGSSVTSGASVRPGAGSRNITVIPSDHPYGLFQFGVAMTAPAVDDPMVLAATEPQQTAVPEETGTLKLLVVRAQGLLGEVSVEWRTVDGTARSAGKTPEDYKAGIGRLTFSPGQRFAYVSVEIFDNDNPESEKYFLVELVNPTGGSSVGPGSLLTVTVQHSDQAYGVFQFAEFSLFTNAEETPADGAPLSEVTLTVSRDGGAIGYVNVTWQVMDDVNDDLIESVGHLTFDPGQESAQFGLHVRDDVIPELDETYHVQLLHTSLGALGEEGKLQASVTVIGNDEPYGVFVIESSHRPITVSESYQDVPITVSRASGTGSYGTVRVDFSTLHPWESYPYLPGGTRAGPADYSNTTGSVVLGPGDTEASFNVTVRDDGEPEVDETFFVRLTGAFLIQGEQVRLVPDSPKLGPVTQTYAQIIISANDNPSGILQLSAESISVTEEFVGVLTNVVRTGGAFGAVTVKFDVVSTSATYGLDYSVSSTDVVLISGEREKRVPVDIINDRLPELAETFVIRLVLPVAGGAELGPVTETLVTIQPSDDPHGAFGFESPSISVEEPAVGRSAPVEIPVIRTGGTLGVVTVSWHAELNGRRLPSSNTTGVPIIDISPTSGDIFFVSNEARQMITLSVLADDVPEGVENIILTLVSATNNGRILGDKSNFTLTILPNDNPHGTLEFATDNYVISEDIGRDTTQIVPVNRVGGSYGQLRVFFITREIDLLEEATADGMTAFGYYTQPRSGKPLPMAGTSWNVKNQPDPLKACAEFCILSEACKSFDYNPIRVDCNWFTTGDYEWLDDRTGYVYYSKIDELTDPLYTLQAKAGVDYVEVQPEQSVLIENGQTEGALPITVLTDSLPELNERLNIELTRVELVGGPPSNPTNIPQLGGRRAAKVTIGTNDDANGVFRIYSNDPRALDDGQTVLVEERAKFSIELVVERQGGSIGTVSVEWFVNPSRTTATKGADFIGDGAALILGPGDMRRTPTIGIEDDELPENDETILVELREAGGGSVIGAHKAVTIIVMANDHVAGLLSFAQTSHLVKEGEMLGLTVKRSSPALGRVTCDWQVKAVSSQPPEVRFRMYTGTLFFDEGELTHDILLHVIVDNEPKIDQEYNVELINVRTEGIRDTGAADVDPHKGVAVITIEGGNEPHGVFSFATQSLRRRVIEGDTMAQLTVDRKFGSIGIVRVYFDVKGGAVTPLDENTIPANPSVDFTYVEGGYITMYDGENSGAVTIGLLEDAIPEVDEVFIVNLTRVELIEPSGSTFRPKLASRGTVAEVTINANDGTQGEVLFATASLDVQETHRNISLTIRRDKGTFGEVSVFCFAQSLKEGAVRGEDFNFDPRDIHFGPGVAQQNIVIEILEDNVPEPDEIFHIMLASPKNGLTVGLPGKVIITILASDQASGVVNFDTRDNMTIYEPTDNTPSASGVARLRLVRAPGIFGVVNVPFKVELIGGRPGDPITDLTPSTGYATFQDREPATFIELTAVPDNVPEEAEVYLVTLLAPEGGADLGPVHTRVVIIERNDAPYGMVEILPVDSSDTSISVEETQGTIPFRIIRSQGSRDHVSVDLVTKDGTAKAVVGTKMVLSHVQQIDNLEVTKWESFHAYGLSYAVLLNSKFVGPLVSGVGSSGATQSSASLINPSVLYRWQGSLVQVQTIETDGARGAVGFTIGGKFYLFIANYGSYNRYAAKSRLYLVDNSGALTVRQDFSTNGATDAAIFTRDGDTYMVVTNYQDNRGQTGVMSHVYRWEPANARFSSLPVQYLDTAGAVAVDAVQVDDTVFVAIANQFDSDSRAYELKSVVYKLDSDRHLTIHQQLDTKGATDAVFFRTATDAYLVLASGQDNVEDPRQHAQVYTWNSVTRLWVAIQSLPGTGINRLGVFTAANNAVYLAAATKGSPSKIYGWDETVGQFNMAWQGPTATDLHPVQVAQSSGTHVAMVTAPSYNTSAPLSFDVSEVAMVGDSDFIPRTITVPFVPGQTEVVTSVTILDDFNAEDTETFFVELANPKQGAELGPNHEISVHILSNDDGHGIIEFADDSLDRREEEAPGVDNIVQLNLVRRRGTSGRVVVAWKASGAHRGVFDINPIEGRVEFANGQAAATLSLTIRDDNESEMDELSYITLTEVLEGGTSLSNRGARIGPNNMSKFTVLANDSPYGVVLWEKPTYLTAEPDGADSTVTMHIIRRQGDQGLIRVTYITQRAVKLPDNEQAVSGEDYVAQQSTVDMREGVTRIPIEITVLSDALPEVTETFWVNITSVQLVGGSPSQGAAPSVRRPGDIAAVVITENDNARGVVQFNLIRNIENRVDVYEGIAAVELKLSRTVGLFGTVELSWQASPREADTDDFAPSGGIVTFDEGQEDAFIVITIVDDSFPEDLQTFDVQLIRVTSGGASIGPDSTVRIGIIRNDSPNGVFSFETIQVSVRESQTEFDPSGQVTLNILRVGTDGVVNVQWRLSADAVYDFEPPLTGTVKFESGENRKQIILRTSVDALLEGEERFTVSLVAADNNGDISPTEGDATVIILADPGAGGVVSISPATRYLVMAEPSANYDGKAEVRLVRGPGVYGEVRVSWQIIRRDLAAFLQTAGDVTFEDLQAEAIIVIQTGDDSIPEVRQTFSLELTAATGAAVDMTARTAQIVITASDYPHGLFEFSQPSQIVVQEDVSQVTIPVVRNYGQEGQVRVAYQTTSSTATSHTDPRDFGSTKGTLTFSRAQARHTLTIVIINDDVSEGPEQFYVNITGVELLFPTTNNYTLVNGLQLDQGPEVGPLSAKTVVIDKNDNAEGFIQFPPESINMIAYEDEGIASVPVARGPGQFGEVSVRYRSKDISAVSGVDYLLTEGVATFASGEGTTYINATVYDDTEMEFSEQFIIELIGVTGGASLGTAITSVVTIAKSDFPNGKFAFVGNTVLSIPNPETTKTVTTAVERTGGLLGRQTVRWRVMGPNSANRVLEETNDISYYTPEGREVTEGVLVWEANAGGRQNIVLTVKPHIGWEIAKTFVIAIYDISGDPANSGSGEASRTAGNLTLTVEKFGDPNGIVHFDGLAQIERVFDEPTSVAATYRFPIVRREGTIGDIDVHYRVLSAPDQPADLEPMEGIARIGADARSGEIALSLLADDVPELEEIFRLQLTSVDGGAEIDTQFNTSVFKVKPNDHPHGRFSIDSDYQTVIVVPSSLKRQLQLNITRNNGAHGRVRISFAIVFNQAQSGISYLPSSGSVQFQEGVSEMLVHVDIESTVFLPVGSTFTVTLTDASFIGVGVTMPPELVDGMSVATVVVPQEAANSEVGFLNSVVTVDEETNLVEITLERLGSYGTVHVDWVSGYPGGSQPPEYSSGQITPEAGTVSIGNGVDQEEFTAQLQTKSDAAELFAVHLPRVPTASVKGGARLRAGHTVCRVEPHGVIQFAEVSRDISVEEMEGREVEVQVDVRRAYGSEDAIQIRYNTVSGTATGGADYKMVENGAITMDAGQISSSIYLQIKPDSVPETDEMFYVNFTSVTRLPTDTAQNVSPRLSDLYSTSTITIRQNSDPYGVLSITVTGAEPDGKVSEPGSATLVIKRTGGSYGRVSVQVRTVGGGEQWDQFVDMTPGGTNDTIGQALGNRDIGLAATAGQDYQKLESTVQFKEDETEVEVKLYILEDSSPEGDEYVFVYLAPQTDGVRVAQPSRDNGLLGFAVIAIRRNDFWNGWIGFYAVNSSAVAVSEDAGQPALLTVERRNATFGELSVSWRAVVQPGFTSTRNNRIDLVEQLDSVQGRAECEKGQRFCSFEVRVREDAIPENATWFMVELFLSSAGLTGAQIDPSRQYANVTLLASDRPNGMIQFAADSRYVYVEKAAEKVTLSVERVGFLQKTLEVVYATQQLEGTQTVAGVRVYHALEQSDYQRAGGVLQFPPGVRTQYLEIDMDPRTASSQPYPKQFQVVLDSVTNAGDLGERSAIITMVDKVDVVVWQLWPQAMLPMTNNTIDATLDSLMKPTRETLTPTEMSIIEEVLGRVLTVAEKQPLQTSVRGSLMSVFCNLLAPSHGDDATRGNWRLSEKLERFAFTYVSHLKCDTCCQTELLLSPECPHVHFAVAKRYPEQINDFKWEGRHQDHYSVAPGVLLEQDHGRTSQAPYCYPLALVEYTSEQWFTHGKGSQLLNSKVFSASVQSQPARILAKPATFRVHTPGRNSPAKRADCVYFDKETQAWTSGDDVCKVTNPLLLGFDNHVDCACKHMSLYAVQSDVRNPNIVGYPFWFHISCFICMTGVALTILAHHICQLYSMFAANLLQHMNFAVLVTEICYVIDAFLSPDHLLADIRATDNNYRCIVMSLFLHYFFLCQFTWMMTQAVNFYKVLVLNDEHTERKYVQYFLLGWGFPALLVAIFYLITYLVYRFAGVGLEDSVQFIYGDINNSQDICFVTNPFAGMAGVVGPAIICLMAVCIVFVQAFQVTPQWQAYDDLYRGHYNIHEIRNVLIYWALIILTWLWGGLHMAYGQMWMLALFCICNILVGLYAFIVYAVLRNPCPCCPTLCKPQKALYNINSSISQESESPYRPNPVPSMGGSIKDSRPSVIHEQWDKDSASRGSHLRVKRSATNGNIYVIPPTPYDMKTPSQPTEDHDSQDFDDLIYALKNGAVNGGFSPSENSHAVDREINTIDAPNSPFERRRINIADTHL